MEDIFGTIQSLPAGQVNHDFSDLTNDGDINCFNNFENVRYTPEDLLMQIVQLHGPTRIIEKHIAASYDAGPWTFTPGSTKAHIR